MYFLSKNLMMPVSGPSGGRRGIALALSAVVVTVTATALALAPASPAWAATGQFYVHQAGGYPYEVADANNPPNGRCYGNETSSMDWVRNDTDTRAVLFATVNCTGASVDVQPGATWNGPGVMHTVRFG